MLREAASSAKRRERGDPRLFGVRAAAGEPLASEANGGGKPLLAAAWGTGLARAGQLLEVKNILQLLYKPLFKYSDPLTGNFRR